MSNELCFSNSNKTYLEKGIINVGGEKKTSEKEARPSTSFTTNFLLLEQLQHAVHLFIRTIIYSSSVTSKWPL